MKSERCCREFVAVTALYVACFLFVLSDFLIGEAFPIHDADGFFAPFYMFVADLARQGTLLTWNPYTSLGSPDFADPQTGAFCPLLLVFGLISGPRVAGFIAYWFFLWCLGGVGVLALARRLRVPPAPAAACALGFAFCGFFVGHGQHTSFVRTLALLPLVLARLDVALARAAARPACEAGVLFGLAGVGGYPGVFLVDCIVVAVWFVARLFLLAPSGGDDALGALGPDEKLHLPGRRAWRDVARTALIFGAVTAVILFPTYFAIFYEAAGYTSRSGPLPREVAITSDTLAPKALVTFASPWLAGPHFTRLWPETDLSSCSVYVSGAVVLLAIYSLCARPASAFRWTLVAVSGFTLAASLGAALPVRGLLYDLIPLFRYFRHASVFRGAMMLFVVVLALLGARDLFRATLQPGRTARLVRAILFSASAAALIWLARQTIKDTALFATIEVPERVWEHFLCGWVLPAVVLSLVVWSAPSRTIQRVGGYALFLLVMSDALGTYEFGVPTLGHPFAMTGEQWLKLEENGVESLSLLDTRGFARELTTVHSVELGPGFTIKNQLLRRPFLHAYSALTNDAHLALLRHRALWSPLLRRERMYFSRTAAVLDPDDPDALPRFTARATSLPTPPLVLTEATEVGERVPLEQLGAAELAPIAPRIYRPQRLVFDVTVPDDGWLLVTDRWARGWRAQVNGQPQRIYKANFVLRAIRVQRGSNHVDMRYHILGYPWLAILTWIVAGVVLMWGPVSYLQQLRKGIRWYPDKSTPMAAPSYRS